MPMRGLLTGLLGLLLLGAGCAAGSQPGAGEASTAGPENRSRIQATVLAVEPLDAHRFRLRLQVDEVAAVEGYESFARPGTELDVYPNFLRTEGEGIDFNRADNQRLLAARDLTVGSPIEALVYRSGGGGQASAWLLMEWQPND